MGLTDTVIATAKAEVGYHEGRSNGHWNNREKYAAQVPGLAWVSDQGQPWCAVFVSWVALKAGAADLFPRTASTNVGAQWFKDRGQWSEYPAVGAQVFFGKNGHMEHTGIVYAFDADSIYTVEGNTNTSGSAEGDGVYLKKHGRRDAWVQGYGLPKYPEPLKSADPARTPAPAPAPVHVPKAGPHVEAAIAELVKARPTPKVRRALRILRSLRK